MAKSPKRQNSSLVENSRQKRPKKEERDTALDDEEPAFEIGGGPASESMGPGNEDFDSDLPTPFDNLGEESSSGATLPESKTPTTNLVNTDNSGTDDKKKTKNKGMQQSTKRVQQPSQTGGHGSSSSTTVAGGMGSNSTGSNTQQASSKMQTDPDKLSDALFSAGVDIREEEALLNSSMNITKTNAQNNGQVINNQIPPQLPFLHPTHVASFMKRVGTEQNFHQDFSKAHEVLSLMSTACEAFMRDIITNSLVISRHRRRSIKLNSGRRSEVSRALRDLAIQQKEQEEKRVKRRISMGLEKETAEAKMETEETLHRASNATANMMIAGGKKKYSWLNAGPKANNNSVKVLGKVSSDVAARGEIGIRYREAREEPGIVMRDLLNALENRRVGVNTVIPKGYARIRD
ncbi:LANO_0A06260g1_1 [Lachancea nothofagi CBS 11611]|uniref:Transcription initiation factor TFIID subunit 4 n=1 Tax=Lachancea nothofagi CBS 11611 TaxID=1266666 RepID=A0A1G4IRQ4_9SACH|nr:LANO_0A06260g1_1 [Lachancea nothofagi CBS 11611]